MILRYPVSATGNYMLDSTAKRLFVFPAKSKVKIVYRIMLCLVIFALGQISHNVDINKYDKLLDAKFKL